MMRAAVVHYMYAEWLQSIYVWFYDAFPQVYVHIHQKMDLTLLKFKKNRVQSAVLSPEKKG